MALQMSGQADDSPSPLQPGNSAHRESMSIISVTVVSEPPPSPQHGPGAAPLTRQPGYCSELIPSFW